MIEVIFYNYTNLITHPLVWLKIDGFGSLEQLLKVLTAIIFINKKFIMISISLEFH